MPSPPVFVRALTATREALHRRERADNVDAQRPRCSMTVEPLRALP